MPPVSSEKTDLRREITSRRDCIPGPVRAIKDEAICERFVSLPAYKKARSLLLFASFRSEVSTTPIIRHALNDGKRVCLPRVNRAERKLDLFYINGIEDLESGYMGIPEPVEAPERKVSPGEMDLIMMPGIAFDSEGGRLGYGGGYYDRLIGGMERRPPLVAVAYEEQILEKIPVEEHDIRVDVIITDRRLIEVKTI
jgi:5-formyltetrahydrofolate cyclo-ligase